ncbi:ribonuclease J [Larsenimonas rhizosphaerae]|uniref:Ribonuclease J n=1 Tax=Larsenimonas rhizosphaerae TaxID=2944682 RepID=A0AA41ZN97_9GAMM|nr:ribonuclease J [Larsenimonas rhizosphaerae]MCM2129370.1 ribonuclease J [Larsenimonas rhizosphaerae]MCX2524025.1 ribonuclease J [Larsenimonas rhizosphaerae]
MPPSRIQVRPRLRSPLVFHPLGGCGEIGMNLSLYGYKDHWIAVDCGMMIRQDLPNTPLQSADVSHLAARQWVPRALFITHGHEDHIGAIAWVWPKWGCPIYATPLACALMRARMSEQGLRTDALHEISPGDTIESGPFSVRYLPVTHSIPESCSLLLTTPAGRVLHTGDWKLDPTPVIGKPVNPSTFKALAPVDMVIGDSTCADVQGHSRSEQDAAEALEALVRTCTGRVVVSCFSSNMARLKALGDVARHTGRRIGLLGRSMDRMVRIGLQLGYLDDFPSRIPTSDLGYLPPEEVLIIATGSQGEPRSALARMAQGSHRELDLTAGDSVIFSARAIPGNEEPIQRLKEGLKRQGAIIFDENNAPDLHASGHPSQEELETFYSWVAPRALLPVHGEPAHQQAHQNVARQYNIKTPLAPLNGNVIHIRGPHASLEEHLELTPELHFQDKGRRSRQRRPGLALALVVCQGHDGDWYRQGRVMWDIDAPLPLDEQELTDWLDELVPGLGPHSLKSLRRELFAHLQAYIHLHTGQQPALDVQLLSDQHQARHQ